VPEVESSSIAAPWGFAPYEAPSRGMRGQTGSEGITRWVLVGSNGPQVLTCRRRDAELFEP